MRKFILYALAICGITLIPISLGVKKEEKANQNLESIVNECASNPILLSFIDNPVVINSATAGLRYQGYNKTRIFF